MTPRKKRLDPIDALVVFLFWLRIAVLGLFGLILILQGHHEPRLSSSFLGVGLVLGSVASYFVWHPARPNNVGALLFGVPGAGLVLASFFL
jgi:hypothetical protein